MRQQLLVCVQIRIILVRGKKLKQWFGAQSIHLFKPDPEPTPLCYVLPNRELCCFDFETAATVKRPENETFIIHK